MSDPGMVLCGWCGAIVDEARAVKDALSGKTVFCGRACETAYFSPLGDKVKEIAEAKDTKW